MSKQNKSELEKAEERAVNITGPMDLGHFPEFPGKVTHIDLTSPRKDKRKFTKTESRQMADFLVELYYQHEHKGLPLPRKLSRRLDKIRNMLTEASERSR